MCELLGTIMGASVPKSRLRVELPLKTRSASAGSDIICVDSDIRHHRHQTPEIRHLTSVSCTDIRPRTDSMVQLQGAVTGYSYMVQLHGTVTWNSYMVQLHGPVTWYSYMVQLHGTVTWYSYMTRLGSRGLPNDQTAMQSPLHGLHHAPKSGATSNCLLGSH